MTYRPAFLPFAALLALTPSLGHAEVKATLKDRFDQIVATFIGDPAANVDIDLKHVLDQWRAMKPKPLDGLSAEDARRQPTPVEAAAHLLEKEGKTIDPYPMTVKDVTISGAHEPLVAHVYVPGLRSPDVRGSDGGSRTEPEPTSTKALRPLIVFFHGGGFVLANLKGAEASAKAIAHNSDAIVVSVEYRLAPEHKFPAAPDDALAAYKWVSANARTLGGDPGRIALAGEGAGGNLAVNTAIAARDAKLPKPIALALIAPAAGINLKTNSWMEDSAARPWNKEAVNWALKQYLPSEAVVEDPRLDIVGKASVEGLPPTIIVTAEDDPLRSDGERLGGKLKRATVPVEMRDYPGVTHDFFGMGAAVAKAAQAERFVGDQLKKAFHPPSADTVALEQLGVAPYPEAPDPPLAPTVQPLPSMPKTPN